MNKRPENFEIIEQYLNHYRHSPQSVKMRRSNLNYFFNSNGFNYSNHIFDITTAMLIEYHDYLKNLDAISLQTRRNRWNILVSFLNFTMEFYNAKNYKFIVIIPEKTINWTGAVPNRNGDNSNKNILATKKEIEMILNYLKMNNFKYYLAIRILVETGMRIGELVNIEYPNINFEYRHIKIIKGKTGKKIYGFSNELSILLKILVSEREKIKTKNKCLFMTNSFKPYSERRIEVILQDARKVLNLPEDRWITSKTFRKSINTYRKKELNCSNENCKILVGHKARDVNIENYTIYDFADLMNLYDKYFPYQNLNL